MWPGVGMQQCQSHLRLDGGSCFSFLLLPWPVPAGSTQQQAAALTSPPRPPATLSLCSIPPQPLLVAAAATCLPACLPAFCCRRLSGKEVLYDWHNAVVGVATGDMGVAKDGSRKPSFSPGADLLARLTLFGEGARGSLSEVRRQAGRQFAASPGC
eukprot:GHRQ01025097.1.p1 GENE.GHRQ01025097.1~~GHRQ01025097.1.p1  ORF type:complete len:156 (+),score=49.39 GHRQ01025097.1:250-717(+)